MKSIKDMVSIVLGEMTAVLSEVDENQVESFYKEILKTNTIVVCGAGRVGMAVRGFGMRLGHLGFSAHTVGDSTVPSIGKGDMFVVASGSGETQTIYDLVVRAKEGGATIAAVTGNPDSRIGKLADIIVVLKAPSKTKPIEGFHSIQPMTTLNEQCLGIFFDIVVLYLMQEMNETHDTMWKRHSTLE